MLTKKEWDKRIDIMKPKAEDVIRALVDFLIVQLYCLDKKSIYMADGRKLKKYGLLVEAINWGDLHCVSVTEQAETYIVIIEEASPDCYNLQYYIFSWLKKWGWRADVITEW